MQNYFKLFDLQEYYNIDLSLLNSKYFALLAQYHPDKASTTEEGYKFSALSSVINNGYKILLDDFERAAHILELHYINIKDDGKAPKLSFDILEEILDYKEKLENATDEEKQKIYNVYLDKRNSILAELPILFASNNYKEAAIKTMLLKYYK